MSCGCKSGNTNKSDNKKLNAKAFGNSLYMRIIIFLITIVIVAIVMVPIIIPMILIMLFNKIVLNRDTNVNNGLLKLGKLFRTSKKRIEDNPDDYEDINNEETNPDDYELMDVEVID